MKPIDEGLPKIDERSTPTNLRLGVECYRPPTKAMPVCLPLLVRGHQPQQLSQLDFPGVVYAGSGAGHSDAQNVSSAATVSGSFSQWGKPRVGTMRTARQLGQRSNVVGSMAKPILGSTS